MRVLVTGATGYVGSAVTAALARAGHEVLGLVRSREKAADVERLEALPVIGSMGDPSTFRDAALSSHAIVHCAVEYSKGHWELDRKTIDACLGLASDGGQDRLFVYTSGAWVYGDTGDGIVDEGSPLNPPAFIAPRVEHENRVLAANRGRVRTLVVRPGCLYGGRGGLTAAWFESAVKEGAARVVGDGTFRWTMVHADDLGEAYARAVEAPWGGEVFNLTDRSRFTVLECAVAASRAAGGGGRVVHVPLAEAAKAFGPFAACLTLSQHVDSRKAVRMLGWQPRHGGFADGAARYFASWKALAKR